MRSILVALPIAILGLADSGCCFFGGCPCGAPSAATYAGTMLYTVMAPAADGGTAAAPTSGSASVSVTLDAFDPIYMNDLDNSYCGGKTFVVVLGPSCALTATVVDAHGRSGSASIASGQSCSVSTATGGFETQVTGGTIGISGALLNVLISGDSASVNFEGSVN